jgi:chromosome segregation ATPase
VQELKEIGQRIREQLPDWLKGRIAEGERQGRPARETAVAELETRLDEIGNDLEEITRQLREGDLSEERRVELANRLSELSREQARLEVQRENLNDTP